ncbi:flagellar motor switch protein FliG [Piscirickettsia litoralis]|uniref:Flagellar motor switch protein FliG n=1 Tax=Piscirickettsia litoralis TaxID=1891921 RepID=A0ABX3A4V3_9GAMM|nr:flagellar motor switch protein FliG [Piscirickettsia litoralis]ODN42696.1 flagellar motor switch protein FliG [Piscirickettsia litoralis]
MSSEESSFSLDGIQKSSIFLMTIGKDIAATILQHLNPREVQRIGEAMVKTTKVEKSEVKYVFDTFYDAVARQTGLGIGSDEYIREMLVGAMGEDKAGGVIERILIGGSTKGLDSLKWMDARAVADVIRYEHPQIMSIVLSYIDGDQAAEVLGNLPMNQRSDLMMRVASLEAVQPAALRELNEILEKQFAGKQSAQSAAIGGVKTAADIMNFLDSTIEGEIMEEVRAADEELGQQIEDLMFVFDDLINIADRDMQRLLTDIEQDQLMLALKGADNSMKEKIFNNMSSRAAAMLREDLEVSAPARLSDVEAAQKEILATARRLAEQSEISLGGAGGEEMV